MVDERPQDSKGICKHLKKFFKVGSRSTPHSQSNLPQPFASTHGRDIPSALVSSGAQGVQTIEPSRPSSSTRHHITPQWSGSPSSPPGSALDDQPLRVDEPTSPQRQPHGTINDIFNTPTEQETPKSAAKAILGVASSFTQRLLRKAPDLVSGNPVKTAFGIARIILQIKDDVKDNLDAVERRISSTAAQLLAVQEALATWKPSNAEETQREVFERTLNEELTKLTQLKKQSPIREVADHEENKKQIADIFERINQAREQLVLVTSLRVHKTVHAIQEGLAKSLLKDLKVSEIADHKYYLEGKERRLLHRGVCTPGTRVRILGNITSWANDTSSESQTVYWLFGPAGSGKTTIAYTVARRFEFAGDADDTTILGGNFFCSRLFDETQRANPIVRTIVYHLALKCKPFADALCHSGRFETIHHNVRSQLEGLLIGPWDECKAARLADRSLPAQYLIIIDALDEIDGRGGSEFLRVLLNVIDEHRLQGLKFFATSRPDPDLVTHLESFENKMLYHLEQVPIEEAQADIARYLKTSLPDFALRPEMENVVVQAAGLFIYAATVVKYLEDYELPEQEEILAKLQSSSDLAILKTSDGTSLLDDLYLQILSDAFHDLQPDVRSRRLQILYTFLCTAERTSTSIVVDLLFSSNNTNSTFSHTLIADKILQRLHAVLYTEHSKVLWYHKSFPDFLFDRNRSKEFWCNQAEHHRRLTDSCFLFVKTLRFNIASIPSSFSLDSENSALPGEVERNISPVLSYSCRNWDHHLSGAACSDSGPLCGTLTDFLQLRVLFWIEAMNLLGSCGLCDPMLRMAHNWTMKYEYDSLSEDFAEAASFAVYFCGSAASLSTPHLYISALATWPRNSKLTLGWRSHFPGIPRFTNASVCGRPVLTLKLGSEVSAVACSIDGRRIATGSHDKSVRVWGASTGEELNVLEGHTDSVISIAFSSDGGRIVSGSHDKSVRIWNTLTGEVLNVLEGHNDSVISVAFSSDGKQIVTFSNSVRVWDTSTGEVLSVPEGQTERVNSVAFSGDGRQIVVGSHDKSVQVWDAMTGKLLNVLEGHASLVISVAFSSDGRRVVSGSGDKSARVWDASTGEVLSVLDGHSDWVRSVAFSSDGRQIVSGSDDKSVRVWDASTGEELNVLEGHTEWVNSVAFLSDGRRILSGSRDKSVRVWDASTSEVLNRLKGHSDWVTSVALSINGERIATGSCDKSVRVWDASTGEMLNVLEGHTEWVRSVAISNDGGRVVSGSYDKSVWVWDASTGEVLNELDGHTDWVTSVAFSNDGKRIVSASRDKSVRVWDACTGGVLNVLEGHTEWVRSVEFSGDGRSIVTGSDDKSVRVWDASTGEVLKVLEGHTEWVTSVAFSIDGRRIVSSSCDKSVRVWDASTGEVLNVLEGHTDWVRAVALSSDGRRIVSASDDKSVRVWDAMTGEVLNVFEGHNDWVRSVAVSSDGRRIVSGSGDNSTRVWDASTSDVSRSGSELLPFPSYVREKTVDSTGLYTHTGWLLSPVGEGYLMFVPLDALLPDFANILTMPRSHSSSVDFTGASFGPRWHNCYSSL